METIKVSEIKPAKYNPKLRTEKLGGLVKSIKDYGIIMPLLIDGDGNLIDGHRRLESAKKLKIEKVPVIRIDSKIPKDQAFEIVNTVSKKISSGDMIYIFVNGGHVGTRALNQINQLIEIIGDDGLKKLAHLNASYHVLDYALRVRKYCHEKTEAFLKRTIFWLATNKMGFTVRRAMEANVKREVIIRAIANNRPLKPTFK